MTTPIRTAAAAARDPETINIWAGTGYRDATEEPVAGILRSVAGARQKNDFPKAPITAHMQFVDKWRKRRGAPAGRSTSSLGGIYRLWTALCGVLLVFVLPSAGVTILRRMTMMEAVTSSAATMKSAG